MTTQHLVPVLDVLEGDVVWARAGERENYRPIESKLSDSANPVELALAINQAIGLETFYVADLDSLIHALPPNLPVFEKLIREGFQIWVDANWSATPAHQIQELEARLATASNCGSPEEIPMRPILSSESLSGFDALNTEFQRWEKWNPIFSFDLKNGHPIWNGQMPSSHDEQAQPSRPINEALETARQIGFSTVIVLDLGFVGTGVPRVGQHLDRLKIPTGLEIISGGGVNDDTDVNIFIEAGCSRVLVCTALHRGVW